VDNRISLKVDCPKPLVQLRLWDHFQQVDHDLYCIVYALFETGIHGTRRRSLLLLNAETNAFADSQTLLASRLLAFYPLQWENLVDLSLDRAGPSNVVQVMCNPWHHFLGKGTWEGLRGSDPERKAHRLGFYTMWTALFPRHCLARIWDLLDHRFLSYSMTP
jgi:hypothetical protein